MKRTTALAAAGALVLTVAGGMSALAVIDRPAAVDPEVIVQYVDQAGNPVTAPGLTPAPDSQPLEIAPLPGVTAQVTPPEQAPRNPARAVPPEHEEEDETHETAHTYEDDGDASEYEDDDDHA